MSPSDPFYPRPQTLPESGSDGELLPPAEVRVKTEVASPVQSNDRQTDPQFRAPRPLPPLSAAALSQVRLWQTRQSQLPHSVRAAGPSGLYETIVARKLLKRSISDSSSRSPQSHQPQTGWSSTHPPQHQRQYPRLLPHPSLRPSAHSGKYGNTSASLASDKGAGRMTGQYPAVSGPSMPRVASGMAVADLLSGGSSPQRGDEREARQGGGRPDYSRPRYYDGVEGREDWQAEEGSSSRIRSKGRALNTSEDSLPASEGASPAKSGVGLQSTLSETPNEGLAYQYAPVQQVIEGRENIEYILQIREQPKHSRMCGVGEKADRRPIDPAPIVQLRVITHPRPVSSSPSKAAFPSSQGDAKAAAPRDTELPQIRRGEPVVTEEGEGWEDKAWYLENPCYFMCAMLADPEKDEELHLLADGKTRYTTGSCVSCLYHLKDIDGSHQGFFVFPDLSIRVEGRYRLKLCLFETIGTQVHHCKSIYSSVFMVYTAKRFPGMEESTQLSRAFAGQGLKVRVRKNARGKRPSRASAGSGGGGHDRYQDEGSDDEMGRRPPMIRRIDSSESESKRFRSNRWGSGASSNEYVPQVDPRHKGSIASTISTRMSGSTGQHSGYSPQNNSDMSMRGSGGRSNTFSSVITSSPTMASNRLRAWTTSVTARDAPPYAAPGPPPASESAARHGGYAHPSHMEEMETSQPRGQLSHQHAYPSSTYSRPAMPAPAMQAQGSHMLPPLSSSLAASRTTSPPPRAYMSAAEAQGNRIDHRHQQYQQRPPQYTSSSQERQRSEAEGSAGMTAVPSHAWDRDAEYGNPPSHARQQHEMMSAQGTSRPSVLHPHSGYAVEGRREMAGGPLGGETVHRSAYGPAPPSQQYPPAQQYQPPHHQQYRGGQQPHDRPAYYDAYQEDPSRSQAPLRPLHHTRERSISDPRRVFTPPAPGNLAATHHSPRLHGAPAGLSQPSSAGYGYGPVSRPGSSGGPVGPGAASRPGVSAPAPVPEGVTILPPLERLPSSQTVAHPHAQTQAQAHAQAQAQAQAQRRDRAGTMPSSFHSSYHREGPTAPLSGRGMGGMTLEAERELERERQRDWEAQRDREMAREREGQQMYRGQGYHSLSGTGTGNGGAGGGAGAGAGRPFAHAPPPPPPPPSGEEPYRRG